MDEVPIWKEREILDEALEKKVILRIMCKRKIQGTQKINILTSSHNEILKESAFGNARQKGEEKT